MKNSKIRNRFIFIFFSCLSIPTFSADLFVFNTEKFQIIESKGSVSGYYVGGGFDSSIFQDENHFNSCSFYFINKKGSDGYNIDVFGFSRNAGPYVRGLLSIENKTWRLVLQEVPKGCSNKTDINSFLLKEYSLESVADLVPIEKQGVRFSFSRKTKAIGIRYSKKDLNIHSNSQGSSLNSFLLKAYSPLVAISAVGQKTYIKYVDEKSLAPVYGWVLTKDIADPFSEKK